MLLILLCYVSWSYISTKYIFARQRFVPVSSLRPQAFERGPESFNTPEEWSLSLIDFVIPPFESRREEGGGRREEGGPHPPQVWSGLTSRPSVVYSDDIDTDCACPLSLTLLVHQIIISPQLEANVSLLAPTLKDLFPDQTQMFTSLTSLEIWRQGREHLLYFCRPNVVITKGRRLARCVLQ